MPIESQTGAIPGVKHPIAIASGKGGVGKSTVAVNLAVALGATGAKVGLLDADIYGPSIPTMMGVQGAPAGEGQKIEPLEGFGIKLMSLGFLLPDNAPVIWRGPMVAGAIQQFLRDVEWGALDYLLIDLPPGTGDAQLTLAQTIPLTGVVICMTPQDVAMRIASKALGMFRQLKVKILGIIENMSYFVCPHCNASIEIFSRGGGKRASERLGVPLLGEIPLDPELRIGGDLGQPILIRAPESPTAQIYRNLAEALIERVRVETLAAPVIHVR
jgi:ATP-binding protein involved in chromosome partitioning